MFLSLAIVSKCFKNNTPGDDWISNFVKRNRLSKRAASNIKRSRSAVNADIINKYFDELEATFERLGMLFSFFFLFCFAFVISLLKNVVWVIKLYRFY